MPKKIIGRSRKNPYMLEIADKSKVVRFLRKKGWELVDRDNFKWYFEKVRDKICLNLEVDRWSHCHPENEQRWYSMSFSNQFTFSTEISGELPKNNVLIDRNEEIILGSVRLFYKTVNDPSMPVA